MVQVPYNRHFAGARMKFPDVYHGLKYYFTINGGNQSKPCLAKISREGTTSIFVQYM